MLYAVPLLNSPISRDLAEICLWACRWEDQSFSTAQILQRVISMVKEEKEDLLRIMDASFMCLGKWSDESMPDRMAAELAQPILSGGERHRYILGCIYYWCIEGDLNKCESMIQAEKAESLTPCEMEELLTIELVYIFNLHLQHKALEITQKGLSLARQLEANRSRKPLTLTWSEYHATVLAILSDWSGLSAMQQTIDELRKDTAESLELQIQNLAIRGHAAEQQGLYPEAIAIWQEMRSRMIRFVGRDSGVYLQACCQLGMLSAKAGRQDDAFRYYDEALELCRNQAEDSHTYQVLLNNYGALNLDCGKPDAALPLLEEAIVLAEPLGGIPLAEPKKNLARYYLMQGDQIRARELYEQVYPVFSEGYGPQHAKTREVQRQLQLLKDPLGSM